MKNRVYIHILLWTVYFALVLFFKTNNLSLGYAIKHTLVAGSISVALFYCYSNLVVNRYFEKQRYVWFSVLSIATLVFFCALKLTLEAPFFKEFYEVVGRGRPGRIGRTVFVIILSSMVTTFIITILENIIIRERKAQILLSEYNEAKFSYLKAQINPHFLFNALNNIYSLSVIKSDKTPKMVLNLADLLRYSIYEGQKEKVRITDEIKQIKKYLELYQSTQEKPVAIEFEVLGNISNEKIEPMMLIPLIENCIKHGDFSTNPEAYAQIILEVRDNGIRFTTLNSTSKANVQKDAVGGVGLENIKKRLELKYPNTHSFSVMDNGDSFEVFLNIQKLEAA